MKFISFAFSFIFVLIVIIYFVGMFLSERYNTNIVRDVTNGYNLNKLQKNGDIIVVHKNSKHFGMIKILIKEEKLKLKSELLEGKND